MLSLQKYRWRGAGIKRSESARLINMRQPSLQPRQNSHPNLVHQTSFSSSSSSLADRSSIDSPSKLTTYSLSNTDYQLQVHDMTQDKIFFIRLKYFLRLGAGKYFPTSEALKVSSLLFNLQFSIFWIKSINNQKESS